ncbi:MAG: exodeoxyribonuclease III [Thermaceae bacterium]|nr:exodeoxyribonuclease III [Thermaceae bacterium]
MRAITLNLNGIRSASSKGAMHWLQAQDADLICLQEVRAAGHQFPLELSLLDSHQTHWHFSERPGYSGVGLLSRKKPKKVTLGMSSVFDAEGRLVRADFKDFSAVSVYVPSGSSGPQRHALKRQFLDEFLIYLKTLVQEGRELLVCGDINIAHKPIDLKNWRSNQKNSGFLPEEREWLDRVLELGYVDTFRHLVGPEAAHYSWWSARGKARENNVGWRLDYHFTTPGLAQVAKNPSIYHEQFFSDHAPVMIDYTISL